MAFADLVGIVQSESGWIVLVLLFVEQAFNPFWKTRLQEIASEPAEDVREAVEDVDEKVERVEEKQLGHIQVTRALSREEDTIDDEAVDDYLAENGVGMDYFRLDNRNHSSTDD